MMIGTLLLCLAALYYAVSFGRINSDLDSLIRPSEDLKWFVDNEHYKQQFPYFEQTAVLVVSGGNAGEVDRVAAMLKQRLTADAQFQSVFAPGVSDFVLNHKHYFLEVSELQQWVQGIEYAYGPALRLADDAGVVNFLLVVADHLRANRGLPLPGLLASGANSIRSSDQDSGLALLPPLSDPDVATHYQLVVVQGVQDLTQQLPNELIVRQLRDVITTLDLPSGVEVRLTGEVALAHEEIQAALNGVGLAGVVSIVLLALILGFGIRSVGFVAAIFAMLAAGVILTLALAVLVVGAFNTLSLIFVVMFFGLGVDFAVHFGLRVRESQQTLSRRAALKLAAHDVGPALLLCMLTSSIAFLAFVPTDYVGLAELGLISAMGMVVAFLLSITLLPALLSHTNLRRARPDRFNLDIFALPTVPTLIGFGVFVLASSWFAKDLTFDYSVLAMRDADTQGMQAFLELQEAGITTDYSISVLVDQKDALELTSQLKQLDSVGSTTSPGDLVPRDQAEKFTLVQSVAERFRSIDEVYPGALTDPEDLASAVAYLKQSLPFARAEDRQSLVTLLASLSRFNEPQLARSNQQLETNLREALSQLQSRLRLPPFALDDLPPELKQRFISANGEYLIAVQPAEKLGNREETTRFIRSVSAVAPNVAGRSVVEWGVGALVVEAFAKAVGFSLIGILILLMVYFRRLSLAMLVLLPVVVSLLGTFAICELTGLSLNMANILVVPLILGLGVDTGIHVVHRATNGVDRLYSSSTARAVVISALTTIGTFFSLSFSPHLGAASIGVLLTVAISLLVVVTFVLLPTLIRLLPEQTKD